MSFERRVKMLARGGSSGGAVVWSIAGAAALPLIVAASVFVRLRIVVLLRGRPVCEGADGSLCSVLGGFV